MGHNISYTRSPQPGEADNPHRIENLGKNHQGAHDNKSRKPAVVIKIKYYFHNKSSRKRKSFGE